MDDTFFAKLFTSPKSCENPLYIRPATLSSHSVFLDNGMTASGPDSPINANVALFTSPPLASVGTFGREIVEIKTSPK